MRKTNINTSKTPASEIEKRTTGKGLAKHPPGLDGAYQPEPPPPGPPAQALMSLHAFQTMTNLGENRVSIVTLDNILREYHALPGLPAPDDASVVARLGVLDRLLLAIDAYIHDKGPDHKRVPPVQEFRIEVEYERNIVDGTRNSRAELVGMITHNPDQPGTRAIIVNRVAHVPSMRDIVRQFINTTNLKAEALTALAAANKLDKILDAGFVDNPVKGVIDGFNGGNNSTADEIKVMNLAVKHCTNLANLKAIFGVRFNFSHAQIKGLEVGRPTADGTVAAEVDWDVPGLKRAYNIMTSLKKGHAADNNFLQKLKRYDTGGEGWHGGDEIAIGYTNLDRTIADGRTLGDRLTGTGNNVFAGKNSFDNTVRHEVGHAVDAKGHFSDAYCINNAAGGNWKVYGNAEAMIQEFMTVTNSALSGNDFFKAPSKQELLKLLIAGTNVAAVKRTILQNMRALAATAARFHADQYTEAELNFPDSVVNDDLVFEGMFLPNLKKPYTSSYNKSYGTRTYVYSNANYLSSYQSTARARQVSNYQFRAPKEWFAEAYAAFYEPDDTPRGYGSSLQGADAATYGWFAANVDIDI